MASKRVFHLAEENTLGKPYQKRSHVAVKTTRKSFFGCVEDDEVKKSLRLFSRFCLGPVYVIQHEASNAATVPLNSETLTVFCNPYFFKYGRQLIHIMN